MMMRRFAVATHRWLGLAAAAFWLIQALTGVTLVFHWEWDDALIAGAHRATDMPAIERRLDALRAAAPGTTVSSVWATGGAADRFDVHVDEPGGHSAAIRIDGSGDVLRTTHDGPGSLLDRLVLLHQQLLLGDNGGWIVGTSGSLLLVNLLLGLFVGWPRRRAWRQSLAPPPSRLKRRGRFYGWHRAVGLWAALPALALVAAGTMLVFEEGTSRLLGARPVVAAVATRAGGSTIGFADAARIALDRFHGATLTAVIMPGEDGNWTVRVRQPGELRRAFGTTTVILGQDGRVLAESDALHAPWARRFVDALYAIHTGEVGGTAGRLAVATIGLWLATMVVLGVALWWSKRPKRARIVEGGR